MRLPVQGSITTDGLGSIEALEAFGLDPFDLAGKALKLTLVVSDVSKIRELTFFIGTEDNLPNYIKYRFSASTADSEVAKSGELFTVHLQFAEINAVGGAISLSPRGKPSMTGGFTGARFVAIDDGTGPITVDLLAVETVPMVPGAFCSVTFDDSDESVFSRAYPKMAQLGFAGTTYAIAGALGSVDRGNLNGLRVLAKDGWEIGGHAATTAAHNNPAGFAALTAQQLTSDLASLIGWMRVNFPDAGGEYSLAYPHGRYEYTTDGIGIDTAVRAAGFGTGRTILDTLGVPSHSQIESLPSAMPYRLRAMSGISEVNDSTDTSHPDSLVSEGGMLDKLAVNGGWMILVFHKIVAAAPSVGTEVSQAGFDAIMDGIATRNIAVGPVRDVIRPLVRTQSPRKPSHWVQARLAKEDLV